MEKILFAEFIVATFAEGPSLEQHLPLRHSCFSGHVLSSNRGETRGAWLVQAVTTAYVVPCGACDCSTARYNFILKSEFYDTASARQKKGAQARGGLVNV